MSLVLGTTKYYAISDPNWLAGCCDTIQFTYHCLAHGNKMGCYFCQFDYDKECECV